MAIINRFDKATAKRLLDEVIAALQPLAAHHGLEIRPKGGQFRDVALTMRLEFGVQQTADGTSKDQVEFEQHCSFYGLQPEHFGATFTTGTTTFRLVGFAPRRRSKPYIAERVEDGKRYVFGHAIIKQVVSQNT